LNQPQLDLAKVLGRFRQPLAHASQEGDNLIGRAVCLLRLRLPPKNVTQPVVESG
jgi:hypothetical protein